MKNNTTQRNSFFYSKYKNYTQIGMNFETEKMAQRFICDSNLSFGAIATLKLLMLQLESRIEALILSQFIKSQKTF